MIELIVLSLETLRPIYFVATEE